MSVLAAEIVSLVQEGAIFYVSHSGGKDSQAMYAYLSPVIPHEQLVVVHADLGEVEWPGVKEHIERNITHDLHVVRANKTLIEMVEKRRKFPSSKCRQCTSDLKRAPIMKFIRNDMKGRASQIAVNCLGIRAGESTARSRKRAFSLNQAESVSVRVQRTVYDWYPIFEWSTEEVFQQIADAGQKPFWTYQRNERLSCVFCIMGSLNDLRHGAEQNPELYKKYVALEKEIGHTMFTKGKEPISLDKYIGVPVE